MESELRQLQLKCLEILDIVVKILNENDIKYSLCGGTAVGAHLYKGFLPWDDDIDIMMTRENYNKFVKIAPHSLPKGYVFADYHTSKFPEKYGFSFGKVINESTTLIEKPHVIWGVFIDITVYDRIPVSPLRHIDFFLYKLSMSIHQGKMPGKSLKNRFRSLLLDTIFSNKKRYLLFFQWVVESLGRTKHYTYRELFGAYYFVNMKPYRPSVFENYDSIEFEGKRYMIVRDYIEYLQTRYDRTDFREPEENQHPIHYSYLNFNLPYKEYIKQHHLE